jgi:hypothetical protein
MAWRKRSCDSVVAGPEVDEALDPLGQGLQQHRLGDVPVWDLPREVLDNAPGIGPLVRHVSHPSSLTPLTVEAGSW